MKRFLQTVIVALLFLNMFTMVQPLLAQDSVVTDDEVNEIARDVYCPVCESTPLDVCATQACADWRELIRTKLGEGQSKEEIFDYFARQYGDGVLADPPSRGVSLFILWVLPIVLLLLALLFFSRIMRNLRVASDPAPASTAPIESRAESAVPISSVEQKSEDDYLARIEEEVGKSK